MFSVLIDLCKTILQIVKDDNDVKLETRLRISGILEEISNILLDTANKLKEDEYPHYNCVLMEKMSQNLHFQLIEYVSTENLDKLYESLIQASQVEKQYSLRKEPETIPTLENAAAEFKTMSMLIKL